MDDWNASAYVPAGAPPGASDYARPVTEAVDKARPFMDDNGPSFIEPRSDNRGRTRSGYQLVTRTAGNRRQSAAIPYDAIPLYQRTQWALQLLAMQKVVGSSPISRFPKPARTLGLQPSHTPSNRR